MGRATLARKVLVPTKGLLTATVVESPAGAVAPDTYDDFARPASASGATPDAGWTAASGREPFPVFPMQQTDTESRMAGYDDSREHYRLWAELPAIDEPPVDNNEYLRVPEIGVMMVRSIVRYPVDKLCRIDVEVVD